MDGRRIFISYRRRDSSGHTGRIYDALQASLPPADEVFMDVVRLTPGLDFRTTVLDFLATCDIFLAVIGPTWAAIRKPRGSEDYVKTELEIALQSPVLTVPVLVGGATIPRKLPRVIGRLAYCQAIELSDLRWSYDVDRLLDFIRSVKPRSDPGSVDTPAMGPATARVKTSRPLIKVAGSSLAALKSGIGGTSALITFPEGVITQADLRTALIAWLKEQNGLETQTWQSDATVFVQCRSGDSIVSRSSGTSAAVTIRISPQTDCLEVTVSTAQWVGKGVGTAGALLLAVPLAAVPIYGAVKQYRLMRDCVEFIQALKFVAPLDSKLSDQDQIGSSRNLKIDQSNELDSDCSDDSGGP